MPQKIEPAMLSDVAEPTKKNMAGMVGINAFFIAFAPFENPEIAICVAIEHGVRGANAAYVARDVFDYYFRIN